MFVQTFFLLGTLLASFDICTAFELNEDKNWTKGIEDLRHLANTSPIEHMSIFIRNDQGQSVWMDIRPKGATAAQIVVDPDQLTASVKEALDRIGAHHSKSQVFILHTHPKASIEAIYSRSTPKKQDWSVTLPPSRTDLDFIYSLDMHFERIGFFKRYNLDRALGVVVDPTGLYFFRTFLNLEERDLNLSELGLVYIPPPADFEEEGFFYKRSNEKFNQAVGQWSDFHKACHRICDALEQDKAFRKLKAMYSSHLIGFPLEFRPFASPNFSGSPQSSLH